MFTESTQMYFSVIVQMSIGNERKKKILKTNQAVQAGRNRGHSLKVQCTVFLFTISCYLIHALQLCSPNCNNKRNKWKFYLS